MHSKKDFHKSNNILSDMKRVAYKRWIGNCPNINPLFSHLFNFRPSKSKLGILDIFQSFSTSIRVILFEIDKAKEVFIIFHLVYVKSFELYIHKCIIYEEHSWHFFYATAINKVTKFFFEMKDKVGRVCTLSNRLQTPSSRKNATIFGARLQLIRQCGLGFEL